MNRRTGPRAAAVVLTALATVATGVVATLAPPVVAAPALAAPAPSRLVLDEGHIDLFEVGYDATTDHFTLNLKDDTRTYTALDAPSVLRDPADVVLHLPDATTRLEVTDDLPQAYQDLLGPPGTVINYTSEVQQDGAPWPGWSTERLLPQLRDAGITLANGTDDPYRDVEALELDLDITGPGDVFTWAEGAEAPFNLFVDTRTPEPDVIPVPVGSHVHSSWGFTAPGAYEFVVTPRAEKVGGGQLTGPPTTYHVQVGGPDVVNVTPPVLDRGAAEVRVGATLAIGAGAWTPSDALTVARWYLDGDLVHAGSSFTVPERLNAAGPSLVGRTLQVETVARREGYSAARVRTEVFTIGAAATPAPVAPSAPAGPAAVAPVSSVRTAASVRIAPAQRRVERGRVARFVVRVSAAGVTPTGTVRVVVGRARATARLDAAGRAVVRLRLPRTTSLGRRAVVVAYGGDSRVEGARARTRIRVSR